MLVGKLKLKTYMSTIGEGRMASKSLSSQTLGACSIRIHLLGNTQDNDSLTTLASLCTDNIIGHGMTNFLITQNWECNLVGLNAHLLQDVWSISNLVLTLRPILNLSLMKYLVLEKGIIESSVSPW